MKHLAMPFVAAHFPTCDVALLAGSVARGTATSTSDLDIVILDCELEEAYRETFFFEGIPVEAFVHNRQSLTRYFRSDCERGRPTLPRMVAEGMMLRDNGLLADIRTEAEQFLQAGPPAWTEEMVQLKRYMITDHLNDLIGAKDETERLFIVNLLADRLHEFVLRTNRQWTGEGKWLTRQLAAWDKAYAVHFGQTFAHFYQTGDAAAIVALVDESLAPYGGRLQAGFQLGGKKSDA